MRYHFNDFTLDTDRFELSKNGSNISIEPQVLELLSLLIANRNRMVSKDEINEKVWHGRFVSDAALSSRIKSARQALGDSGSEQKVIKTVHKKGFRFVAEVEADEKSTPTISPVADSSIKKQNKPAVAVMPFLNLATDKEQEYFSDGITSDIIAMLSKHRWLDVTSRNAAFGYKGKAIDIKNLGKELEVNYIVEGSVQRVGDKIRVTACLVDAKTGHHKWSDRFDRQVADIFALQDEITAIIVARLEPEIGLAERSKIFHSRPANLQAWDCYHLGIYHFYQFTAVDNLEAQRLLLESQNLDKNFGEAYAWWAYAVVLGMVYWGTKPTQELLDKALTACDKALSLDGQNAVFYSLQARVLLAMQEYDRAIAANQTAIDLNPTLAAAQCGLGDSLAYEGRYDDALVYFNKAIDLSPNDPQLWAFLSYGALVHIFKKDFETAIEWTTRAINIPNCQYWATAHMLVAHAHLGNKNQMMATKQKLLKKCPEFTLEFVREKLFYLKEQDQIDLYIEGLKIAEIAEK